MKTQDLPKCPPQLSGRHQQTWEAIFRHPTSHNLEWHEVRSLLDGMAEVTEGRNGALHATRNGHTAIFQTPRHKDIATVEDVIAIRTFLEQLAKPASAPPVLPGGQLLVVIDHREAKVYRTEAKGSEPQQFVPYDPHGYGRHLRPEAEEKGGKRLPERKSYYDAIAATLRGADQILIFGSGTGESSAMEQLLSNLKQSHADVAKHVVGSVVVDEHHMTEGQLLAQAREFFAVKAK